MLSRLSTSRILSGLSIPTISASTRLFSSLTPKITPEPKQLPVFNFPIAIREQHRQRRFSDLQIVGAGLATFGILAISYKRQQKHKHLLLALEALHLSPEEQTCILKVFAAHEFNYMNVSKTSPEIALDWVKDKISKLENELDKDYGIKQQFYSHFTRYQKSVLRAAFLELDPTDPKEKLTEPKYEKGLSLMLTRIREKNQDLYVQKIRVPR